MPSEPAADLLVIGGGPAGATAAIRAARNGLRVRLLEQARHPRFHIGESFLPRNMRLIEELDLEDGLRQLPQTRKLGASFALGHETEPTDFHFENGLLGLPPDTFNIERAPFDAFLLQSARDAGAEVIENVTVRRVLRLEDGKVALETADDAGAGTTQQGRYLIDASGQSTVIGRHLKTRRTLPDLKKVAYFGHFHGVHRPDGDRSGYPLVVMCEEGWFWFIPIDAERTSVGLVMDAGAAQRAGVPSREMLAWGLSRCPLTARWTERAEFPETNRVTADFSYTCRPYAGPGYFLAGDAATFVDPIFSTGVCLGMMSGLNAADLVGSILEEGAEPQGVRRNYVRFVEGSSSVFFRLVRSYYKHPFRELFLHGVGPLDMHKAVISVLSGHVFPRPTFALRWRLRLFEIFIRLHRVFPLVPRRATFSLLEDAAGS